MKSVAYNNHNRTEYLIPYVLIVDDEEFICQEMVEYLRNRGLPVNYETDPSAAVATIERDRPKAIIVDINMKGLDGLRLLEIVHNIGFKGGAVLMSGDPDAIYRTNISRPNVLYVLEKPIPLATLERYVRAVLDIR